MTIDDLQRECAEMGLDADYHKRMMHKVPMFDVVDRVGFILEQCASKRVLNFGSSWGGLHERIRKVAKWVAGVDVVAPADYIVNCDDFLSKLPDVEPELVVCGEIIEHLSNPGQFLNKLRQYHVPVLITVPNAFSSSEIHSLRKGYENVNIDHVAWYSWRTLKTLLERSGFELAEVHYYNGQPGFAEGLAVLAR